MSGLFGTTRISLNDNFLNRVSPAGVEAGMGHEIAHYALNHGPKDMIYFSIILVVGFTFLRWAFHRMNRPSWNIRGEDDSAGLPLVVAILSSYFFLLTPASSTILFSGR